MLRKMTFAISLLTTASISHAAIQISQVPLFLSQSAPPLNMLVMSRDHTLYYEAYNDASDLDGDGVIDVGYKPDQIDYYGYFNSKVCYEYTGSTLGTATTQSSADGHFIPKSKADGDNGKQCNGQWSGDFLNYLATSRMDAMRRVLYGGQRTVDSDTETILEAAYIPRDGHSWGKAYEPVRDQAVYNISHYTPLSQPSTGTRHLFAVTTLQTASNDSRTQLRVLNDTTWPLWEWVSRESSGGQGGSLCGSGSDSADCEISAGSRYVVVPANSYRNLIIKTWRRDDSDTMPNSQARMKAHFDARADSNRLCGSGPISSINTTGSNNNPFAGANNCSHDNYLTEITGQIYIPKTASYTFSVDGDDAVDVTIDGTTWGWYGSHGSDRGNWENNNRSKSISLTEGWKEVRFRHVEGSGGDNWGLAWKLNSLPKSQIAGYNVRVKACSGVTESLRDESCKQYSNSGGEPIYKPTGLLHDFGESDEMFFGLLTGSYQKNISGGTLRRNISSFTEEVNSQTGIFTDVNGIVANINRLKVIDFNNSNYYTGCNWNSAYKANPIDYDDGNSADCAMWGNPVAEMMFEAIRYFSGASKAHSLYDYGNGTSKDKTHNLAKPTWQPPYKAKSDDGGGYQYCARPVMTVLSDINPSYDYKLPGSRYQSIAADASALSAFDVSAEVDAIGTSEGIHGNNYFIGQSASNNADDAPTPKAISALSWARGLAPEEPSKRGTYYSAGVARYGATNKIAGTSSGKNEVMTYAVALASPLPQIRIPVGSGHVTVIPFAKSVKSSTNPAIDISKFVPTNPVVDYYVISIANTGAADRDPSINGGRAYAKFIINYEDMEVGSDHDMDAIAEYAVALQENGSVKVDIATTFKAGSTVQQMGYVISGTTKDGIYIEIQDRNENNIFYPLNTPKDEDPGWCKSRENDDLCKKLPLSASRTFTPSPNSATGEFLKDPLWLAAKYGMPRRNPATVEGDPDNYFLVTNATTLKSQLTQAFNDILQRNTSVTSPVVKGNTTGDGTFIYRTDFKADGWSGDLIKEKLTRSDDGSSLLEAEWRASEQLPSKGSRRILFAPDSGASTLANFTWNALEDRTFANINLQEALNKDTSGTPDQRGEDRVKYIRDENCGSSCAGFRERKTRLGDIINSSPMLVEGAQYLPHRADSLDGDSGDYYSFQQTQKSRQGMVYVGANDGMLHAFNSTTGAEEFAFIPTAVISNLNKLTDPQYGIDSADEKSTLHQYFVDGTPVVADVYFDNDWHTVLVGSLAAGGRSVFALDITTPDEPKLLWEFSNTDDAAMGYSIPQPTVSRLHSGQWAALIPNGYNSGAGPALFALDIKTGEVIKKLVTADDSTTPDAGNGLSNIRTADMNNDGIVDYVYGGDQQGNLWRFDLYNVAEGDFNKCTNNCANISDQYRVSFGGKPLYIAKDKDDQPLPITAAPTLLRHPTSIGHLVVVATGRFLGFEDKNTPFKQESVYGIWDRQTDGKSATGTKQLSRSDLRSQSMSAETMQVGDETRAVRLISENLVQWYKADATNTSEASVNQWGWYLDLSTGNTPSGERVVNNMQVYGEGLIFSTVTPSSDPCSAGLTGFTYAINPASGGRTPYNVFDFTGDGKIDWEDSLDGDVISGFENPAGGFTIHDGFLYSPDGNPIAIDPGSQAKDRQSWHLLPKED